jgi:hypothetical protein
LLRAPEAEKTKTLANPARRRDGEGVARECIIAALRNARSGAMMTCGTQAADAARTDVVITFIERALID